MAVDRTKIAMPTMSGDGWVFSSERMADFLMANFLASNYSQSNLFKGNIESFAYYVARYVNDPSGLITNLTKGMTTLFSRYFDGVEVLCTDESANTNSSFFTLGIYVQYQTADGQVKSLYRVGDIVNSRFIAITNVINSGTAS